MNKNNDKRRHPRRDVSWPSILLTDQGVIKGEIKNISAGGLFIQCEEPIPLNKPFHMSIMPPDYHVIEVACKMIWSDRYGIDRQDNAFGLGICFLEISDKDRDFFNRFISEQLEKG